MKSLARHIRFLIRRYNRVVVPHVGALIAVDLPPLIDLKRNIMLPPARTLYFNTEITEDSQNLLLNSISKAEGFSAVKARQEMTAMIDNLKSTLSNTGFYILGQIGNFTLKEDKIEFVANQTGNAYDPNFLFNTSHKQHDKKLFKDYTFDKMRLHAISIIGFFSVISTTVCC